MRRLRYITLLAVLWTAPLHAQQPTGTIRGRVTDAATQQPLPTATVTVGSRVVLTQADGRFVLTGVPAGADTVRAKMLGYAPVRQGVAVVAGDAVVVDLALTAQAIGLSEVVVTGYGAATVGDITGAVTAVTDSEFNPGRIVSPQLLIQSKVAGVQVVDNNDPGGGLSIRIRGATSVNASSEPLYVIDGVPLGTGAGGGLSAGRDPLNFLSPNDIESMAVLRDASAAAIYGSNAANGVVLITTKGGRGREGTGVEYSTSGSASSVTRLPDMLNASQFAVAVAQYAPARTALLLGASTDGFGLVDRNAYGQQHDVSFSSAGNDMSYRLSLGYLNQDGIIRASSTERLSVGLNYQQRFFSDRLNVRTRVRGSRAVDKFTPGDVLGNAAAMAPTHTYGPGTIDLAGGYSFTQSHAEYPSLRETGLGSNLLGDNGVPTAANVRNTRDIVDYKLISFFGRLNYNIGDRYLAALSARRDGSSRFGPGNQWGTFPSVALAWRISQEPFMRGIGSLSELKLRGSWARTGNQAFGDYLQYPTYTYSDGQTQVQFGNQFVTTIRPSAVDEFIHWEKTSSYNAGLDVGFSNQRYSGSIDWYTNNTTDLIFNVPVAAGTNLGNFGTTNIGSMRNRGFELSLNARGLER